MTCKKCGSTNVDVQMVSSTEIREKKHGILYWIFIGWWLNPLLWLFLTLPMIIIAIFKPKKYESRTRVTKYYVCKDCGYSWK